jgi:hypothetical protein
MTTPAQYVDGFGNIQLAEGVVRLELVTLSKIEGNNSSVEKVGGLAMSMPAFLRSFNQMTTVVNKMVEQGLITRTPTGVEATKVAPEAAK